MKKTILILSCLLLFTGCTLQPKAYTPLLDSKGYLSSKEVPTSIDQTIANATVSLSDAMINSFNDQQQNVFVSAPSLMLALAMTATGAIDETQDEMLAALHLDGLSLETMHQHLKDMQLSMINQQGIKLHLTNSIWIRDTFKERVLTSFLDTNKEYYAPMIATGDFNSQKMVDDINHWVSDATNEKIKTAIDEPIHPLTQMFLINTLYFKGDWLIPFEKEMTIKRPFLNQEVDTMAILDRFDYGENQYGQFIALPYKDSELKMIVGLPKENGSLSISDLLSASKTMSNVSVDLQMPKVQIELTMKLKDYLIDQGMIAAFDSSLANFNNMATDATKTGLHVADVTQKTFLAIDEKGTEAAAMTKVEMRNESMPMSDAVMHINRPFTLMIVDPNFDIVYFAGVINNPQP